MNCNNDGFYNSVKEWLDAGMPLNSFVLGDCMEGMAAMPEKFADLAIPDPPYEIGEDKKQRSVSAKNDKRWLLRKENWIDYKKKEWDVKPSWIYFDKLFNVSNNQIIWGGNYFSNNLPEKRCWIVWDKKNGESDFGDCELAWTSFDTAIRKFDWLWSGFRQERGHEIRIHPTQKPIALYRWLLQNYAHPGDIILDTHVGSASSLIACKQMGFQYIGFEIDSDYFHDACNRIIQARKLLQQNEIFQREEVYNGKQHEQNELF